MMVRACADAWETVLDLVKIFSSPPVLVNSLHFFVVWRLYCLCTMAKILWKLSLCVPFISEIEVLTARFGKILVRRRRKEEGGLLSKQCNNLDPDHDPDMVLVTVRP